MIAARESPTTGNGEPQSPPNVPDEMNVFLWDEPLQRRGSPKPTNLDHRFVLAYESGRYRWPSEHYRTAFRHVLRVTTDAELGFSPRRKRRRRPNVVTSTNEQYARRG